MRRILVAAVPGSVPAIRRIVGAHAELVVATRMDEAVLLLRELHCDLVLCGVYFDDSRMFDLLRAAKSDPRTREIPFICFRAMRREPPKTSLGGVDVACTTLGADCFVDLGRLQSELGAKRADAEFRKIVLGRLTAHVSRSTSDARRLPPG